MVFLLAMRPLAKGSGMALASDASLSASSVISKKKKKKKKKKEKGKYQRHVCVCACVYFQFAGNERGKRDPAKMSNLLTNNGIAKPTISSLSCCMRTLSLEKFL